MIRDAQLDLIGHVRRESFAADLVEMLMVDYPGESAALGREALKGLVERALSYTNANGITSKNAVKVFLGLWIEYGEGFPRIPDRIWADALFSHPNLPDVLKVAIVRDRFRERVQGRQIEVHQALQGSPPVVDEDVAT